MTNGIEERIDIGRESEFSRETTDLIEGKGVLISFIAPYIPERVNPSQFEGASVTPFENIGMMRVLDNIDNLEQQDTCHFLINSPGGGHQSSYQVARCLRSKFDHVVTYVPQAALSGGTIIALCSDKIVMGPSSLLGPIDPLIPYEGDMISARKFDEAFDSLRKKFQEEQVKEAEIPFPYDTASQNLKLERVWDARGKLITMTRIAQNLLSEGMLSDASEEEIDSTASQLVHGFPDHSYPITREVAREVGLEVQDSENVPEMWDIMRRWFESYVADASDKHIIRYYSEVPQDDEPA